MRQLWNGIVASFTGAWIETYILVGALSLLAVASFTGAWIETIKMNGCINKINVASFTGAWIETDIPGIGKRMAEGRILYGCVD